MKKNNYNLIFALFLLFQINFLKAQDSIDDTSSAKKEEKVKKYNFGGLSGLGYSTGIEFQ